MADLVHVGYDSSVDESTGSAAVIQNTVPAGGSTSYALVLRRETEDVGAEPICFVSTALSGTATETLASIFGSRNFVAVSAATTQTVPTARTMKVTGLSGMVTRTTSTGGQQFAVRVNLRVNTAGTATASSPIAASGTIEWTKDATATVGYGAEPVYVDIPGGVDVPSGASFGLTYQILTSGTASRSTAELSMHGFQF